jgi:hypothetical protein
MIFRNPEFEILNRLVDLEQWDMLLLLVRDVARQLSADPDLMGRALFIPQFDELMQRASQVFVQEPVRPTIGDLMVHVATEVYETGGHTRVIEDVVRAFPQHRHLLILTDVIDSYRSGRLTLGLLAGRFGEIGLEVKCLQGPSLGSKARMLAALIAQSAPHTVFINTHHFDSVLSAAVSNRSAPKVLYLHLCDHNPALGATRSDFIHVDMTPLCHQACNATYPFPHTFLPLSMKDAGVAKRPQGDRLTGVSCGDPHKYMGYCEFTYGQLLGALLSSGVAQIFHIGTMQDAQQMSIRSDLRDMEQDEGAVTFLPDVRSLAEALHLIAPSFFLDSHPKGGGKAMVEALSAGIPILFPRPVSTLPLLNADMAFGESLRIRELKDVPEAIRQLRADREGLAMRSRKVFEDHYSPSKFQQHLMNLLSC